MSTSSGRDVLGDALPHPLHRVDETLTGGARPDERRDPGDVLVAELAITRQRARLQQRLELPALRPPLVVRDVRVEAAHEGAVLALGAQVRVDLPERRLEGELADALHGVHREPGGDLDAVLGVGDEDHVDVAEVVQLARARLPHADDRELRRRDILGGRLARVSRQQQRCVQGSSREVGQGDAHRVDDAQSARLLEIPGRQAQQLAPVRRPEGVPALLPDCRETDFFSSARYFASVSGVSSGSRSAASCSGWRTRNAAIPSEAPSTRKQALRVRGVLQDVGHGIRSRLAKHSHEPQRLIGICRRREERRDARGHGRERLAGPAEVGEADPGKLGEGRRRPRHVSGRGGGLG